MGEVVTMLSDQQGDDVFTQGQVGCGIWGSSTQKGNWDFVDAGG